MICCAAVRSFRAKAQQVPRFSVMRRTPRLRAWHCVLQVAPPTARNLFENENELAERQLLAWRKAPHPRRETPTCVWLRSPWLTAIAQPLSERTLVFAHVASTRSALELDFELTSKGAKAPSVAAIRRAPQSAEGRRCITP
jgi:hypothetical protein